MHKEPKDYSVGSGAAARVDTKNSSPRAEPRERSRAHREEAQGIMVLQEQQEGTSTRKKAHTETETNQD